MIWITAERPQARGLATAWLVRRFVDPTPRFVFIPVGSLDVVAVATGGTALDAGPDVGVAGRWGYHDLLVASHRDGEPALVELGQLARAADLIGRPAQTARSRPVGHPLAPALRAIAASALAVEPDDHRLLARTLIVFDALHAHFRRNLLSADPSDRVPAEPSR